MIPPQEADKLDKIKVSADPAPDPVPVPAPAPDPVSDPVSAPVPDPNAAKQQKIPLKDLQFGVLYKGKPVGLFGLSLVIASIICVIGVILYVVLRAIWIAPPSSPQVMAIFPDMESHQPLLDPIEPIQIPPIPVPQAEDYSKVLGVIQQEIAAVVKKVDGLKPPEPPPPTIKVLDVTTPILDRPLMKFEGESWLKGVMLRRSKLRSIQQIKLVIPTDGKDPSYEVISHRLYHTVTGDSGHDEDEVFEKIYDNTWKRVVPVVPAPKL